MCPVRMRVCVCMKNSIQFSMSFYLLIVCMNTWWFNCVVCGYVCVACFWRYHFTGLTPSMCVCNCGWVRCFVSGVPVSGICKQFMYCRQYHCSLFSCFQARIHTHACIRHEILSSRKQILILNGELELLVIWLKSGKAISLSNAM